ncbi:MAG: VWA domain-containing protein [Deltaproteobacteria bacterium]|nr:VWA domain-containing protein [Deltaproteobacteria bacterium]
MQRRPYFFGILLFACSLLILVVGGVAPVTTKAQVKKAVVKQPISPATVYNNAQEKLGTLRRITLPQPKGVLKGEDKTLSPYFVVKSDGDETERLPLKETSAAVNIAGVIAQVKVRQVFENAGDRPIEAIYVFPGSTRAAVHGMRMRIGERTIEAKIEQKVKARAEYEQAKRQGKRASLLEQERPNVFTMNVANIMPRDLIEVELDYSELLVPDNAIYEFVYPTVVGPRFGGGADPQKDKWIANPYLTEGQKEPYKFSLKVHLETGIPLKEINSPSHKLNVDYRSPASADVGLAEAGGGNKDFVLRYRLAGNKIETGVLIYENDDERFFLLMLEPPVRPTNSQIPSREYIFLLDVSGSMRGFPLNTTKELMRHLLGALRPSDYFNVVLFAGASAVMNPQGSLAATRNNINQAMTMIDRQRGGGGTQLLAGLQAAYGVPKRRSDIARSVVVVTDGYVGVEGKAFKIVHDRLNEANLFAFGIGSSVNRGLIETMARAGLGEPFVVLRPDAAAEQAAKLQEYIQFPVLTSISVQANGIDAREMAPMKIPDLFARRPLIVFGKLAGSSSGSLEVRGISGNGKRLRQHIAVSSSANKPENSALRYLWARKWVEMLDDQMAMNPAPEIEAAITDLGLSYNLLTSFTSFIAIDSEVVNRSGITEKVNQPLPLPEGVSNSAVGGMGSIGKGAALSGGRGGHITKLKSEERVDRKVKFAAKRPEAPMPSTPPPALSAPATASAPMEMEASTDLSDDSTMDMVKSRQAGGSGSSVDRDKNKRESANHTVRVVSSKVQTLANAAELKSMLLITLEHSKCTLKTRLTIVIMVDANGVIVAVQIKESHGQEFAACLRKILMGKATGAKAQGSNIGHLLMEVEPAK